MTTMRERARALPDADGYAPGVKVVTEQHITALLEAVERETVERCAEVCETSAKAQSPSWASTEAYRCMNRIRALAPAREGE